MATTTYQLGLLLAVVGGFLGMNPTGWGVWMMGIGALVATLGLIQSVLNERQSLKQ